MGLLRGFMLQRRTSFQSHYQICDKDDGDNSNTSNEAKTMTTTTALRDDDNSKDLDLYCGLFEDQ